MSLTFLVACQKQDPLVEAPTPSVQQRRLERAAQVPEATKERWNYLNRIRQGDAFNGSIARTLVTDENELGVVLSSGVTLDQVPGLMRQIMTEMAQEFPRQDMTRGRLRGVYPAA